MIKKILKHSEHIAMIGAAAPITLAAQNISHGTTDNLVVEVISAIVMISYGMIKMIFFK